MLKEIIWHTLCKKCRYWELFWSVFTPIQTECPKVQMWENTDRKNSKYGHYSVGDIEHIAIIKMSRLIPTYIHLTTNFRKLHIRLLKFQKRVKKGVSYLQKVMFLLSQKKIFFPPLKPCKPLAAFVQCAENNTVLKKTELTFRQSEFWL